MAIFKPQAGARLRRGSPLANGLVFGYLFNEGAGVSAYDISEKQNDGTLLGPPTWIGGPHGSALSFNASTDRINIQTFLGDIPVSTGPRSFAFWYNPGTSGAAQALLAYGSTASPGGKRISISATTDYLSVATHGHNYGMSGLSLSGWHFAVITLPDAAQSTEFVFYLDGVLQSPSTIVGAAKTVNTDTTYGYIGYGTATTNYYDGDIGSLLIWDRQLSALEAQSLFHDTYQMVRGTAITSVLPVTPPFAPGHVASVVKPVSGAMLNRGHTLADSMTVAYLLNEKSGQTGVVNHAQPDMIGELIEGTEEWVGTTHGGGLRKTADAEGIFSDDDRLNPDGAPGLTMAIRMKPSGGSTAHRNYMMNFVSGSSIGRAIPANDYLPRFASESAGRNTLLTGTTPIVDGQWVDFVGVATQTHLYIYINGELHASVAKGGLAVGDITMDSWSGLYVLRTHTEPGDFNIKGDTDFAYAWERALSASEVRSLYADPYQMFRHTPVVPLFGSGAPSSTIPPLAYYYRRRRA